MDILLTSFISALLLLVEHYLPWRLMLRRELPVLWRYVLGVLALIIPLCVLFAVQGEWRAVLAVVAVVAGGGAAVLGAYGLDQVVLWRVRMREAEERERVLAK